MDLLCHPLRQLYSLHGWGGVGEHPTVVRFEGFGATRARNRGVAPLNAVCQEGLAGEWDLLGPEGGQPCCGTDTSFQYFWVLREMTGRHV